LYSYSKNNFYVTVKNNLITYKGNEILVLGKVTKNSSSKYPYAIKWADNSSVSYISGSGKIYSKAGKVIGEVVV